MKLPEIKQLSEELINMISAGEVVERPASVVKELIENSIDAGASSIKIELIASGLKKISVLDNGIGMTKEQIPLALLPHATSKIKDENDLFNILSLGFRGEALPSIASVSKMRITSSIDGNSGYFYDYKASKIINEGVIAIPKGTKVEVENLFFNTPARFKHLGTEQLELSHISLVVNRLAIANPFISFLLINNGKVIYQTAGDGLIDHIIAKTYGNEVANYMFKFENKNDLYKIKGYTSSNNIFRSNKNAINIIINNRIIRNLNILYAIMDAYKSIIPIGKYPVTILEIECIPSLIDVNVHPSKLEIRFTDEMKLKNLITTTISNVLYNKPLVYLAKENEIKNENTYDLKNFNETTRDIKYQDNFEKSVLNEDINWDNLKEFIEPNNKNENTLDIAPIDLEEKIVLNNEKTIESNYEQLNLNDYSNEEEKEFFSKLRYLGQYHTTYLLLEDDNDLYLIDQHAAMERCMYEKISQNFNNPTHNNYELLVPIKLEFSISEISLILEKQIELSQLGFVIEEFGGTSIIIREVPIWLPKGLEAEFTSDVINHLINNKNVSKAIMYDSLAKKLACKKSIKANMHILPSEVMSLLNNLDKCKMPYTCPHGRPTLVKITKYEVEKLFKRVLNG